LKTVTWPSKRKIEPWTTGCRARRRVVQQVARREVVGAVDDHVPALAEDPVDVLGGEPLLERLDGDVGVERLERALGRLGLRVAEALGRVDDLALEVRRVDASSSTIPSVPTPAAAR
jgi:hypothetical protein